MTLWQIEGKKVKKVTDFIFLGFKITADGNCSHEIKRHLVFGRKTITSLDSILKSRDSPLPTKVQIVKAMVWLVMYGCDHSYVWMWELNHKKGWALKNWCFRIVVMEKTLESPLDSRRSNKSILKEISPEYSLEGLIMKLKFQYFDHLMQRAGSLDENPDPGEDWRQEEKGSIEDQMIG